MEAIAAVASFVHITSTLTGSPPVDFDLPNDVVGDSASNVLLGGDHAGVDGFSY